MKKEDVTPLDLVYNRMKDDFILSINGATLSSRTNISFSFNVEAPNKGKFLFICDGLYESMDDLKKDLRTLVKPLSKPGAIKYGKIQEVEVPKN